MIPGLILAFGMIAFPESPRWLMDHGREDEALQVSLPFYLVYCLNYRILFQILADVHGKGDLNNELVQLEFHEIKAAVEFERKEGAKSYADLLKPGILRRVSLGTSLQAWSQLTGTSLRLIFGLRTTDELLLLGMNVMMYYVNSQQLCTASSDQLY